MQRPSLEGRSILIVDDEPVIVMDIIHQFEVTGAAMTTTNSLHHALTLVEYDGLSGAILDHALGDGKNSSILCHRLKERGIPFVIYSGYDTIACEGALHISKPAPEGALVSAMEGLIQESARVPEEMKALFDEQRQIVREYRLVEGEIGALHAMLAARNLDPTDRAEMEAAVVTRTAVLMRVGERMLEIDEAVGVAALRLA